MPQAEEHFRAPLLWIFLPYLAGLAVAAGTGVGMQGFLLVVPALALTLLALVAARSSNARTTRLWATCLAAAGFLAGAAHMQHALDVPERWRHLPPREIKLEVEITRPFSLSADGRRQSCIARVVAAPALIDDLAGQRIFFNAPFTADIASFTRTQRLSLRGVLEPLFALPEGAMSAADSFDRYLLASGIHFKISRAQLTAETQRARILPRFWQRLGGRFAVILSRGLPENFPATGTYLAMFLGQRSELSPEQQQDFLRSGTMHIFAISGLHIAVIAACLMGALGFMRVPKRAGFVLGLVLLSAFVEATGGTPSARRALIMVAFIWGGQSLRRPANALSALVTAALVVLAIDPIALLSASFQFSYAVVAALLLFGVPLRNRWHALWQPWRGLAEPDWSGWQRFVQARGREILTGAAISCAATLVSTPLSIAAFGLTSPGGVLSNLVLVPVAAYAITAGFVSLVFGLLGALPVSDIFNHAGALILALVDRGAHIAAGLPGMFVYGQFSSPWIAPVLECGLLLLCLAGYATRWQKPRGALFIPVVALVVALVLLVTPGAPPERSRAMKSAYELAMERLNKADPNTAQTLTDEQKARLAEIDRIYQGKIAEREIFLNQRLAEARAKGELEELEKIRKQMAGERASLEEDREDEKNRVRRGGEKH